MPVAAFIVTVFGEQKVVAPPAVMDATGATFTVTVMEFDVLGPQVLVTMQS